MGLKLDHIINALAELNYVVKPEAFLYSGGDLCIKVSSHEEALKLEELLNQLNFESVSVSTPFTSLRNEYAVWFYPPFFLDQERSHE